MPAINEFENEILKYVIDFKELPESYELLVIGIQNLKSVETTLKAHGQSYYTRKSAKKRCTEKPRLSWSSQNIQDFHAPFSVRNIILKECSVAKQYFKKKAPHNDHPFGKKKRFRTQSTKKMGCPAVFKIIEVLCYPGYKITSSNNIKAKKAELMKNLKSQLALHKEVVTETQFYVSFTKPSNHIHSPWTAFVNQPLDGRLKEQVNKCLQESITNIRTIQVILRNYVKDNISKDITSSARSFFPTRKIIYNYVLKYIYVTKASKIDQVALRCRIDHWEKTIGGKFYYRPYDEESKSSFMFCYQAPWQEKLLERYGAIILLDATHKTTKYALPLFFLVTKTNVGYIVCGLFIIQFETATAIKEALNIFKSWKRSLWKPEYFVTDFSEAELKAMEDVFGCPVYICNFHREQAWERWFRTKDNVPDAHDSSTLLKFFRAVASSKSAEEFDDSIAKMYSSEEWNRSKKVQKYFRTTWLPHKEKWTSAFFAPGYSFVIRTNNGIESQNRLLKHTYLKEHTDKSLCGMLDIIIVNFLGDEIKKYQQANSRLSENCRQYNTNIPTFLYNRPVPFIKHVYQRYTTAQSVYSRDFISVLRNDDKCVCIFKSECRQKIYNVDFSVPFCSCNDFYKYLFPCKHMMAVILYYPNFSFNSLPQSYLNSPYLTIDPNFSQFEDVFETDVDESNGGTTANTTARVPPLDSLDTGLMAEPEFDEVVVPPLDPLSASIEKTNYRPIFLQIRELSKSIYDQSFLITCPPDTIDPISNIPHGIQFSSLVEQLQHVKDLMKKYIVIEQGSNIPVLPQMNWMNCSQLPPRKRQKKKQN